MTRRAFVFTHQQPARHHLLDALRRLRAHVALELLRSPLSEGADCKREVPVRKTDFEQRDEGVPHDEKLGGK